MNTIEEIAKKAIDMYIKIPVNEISTKNETMYVSTAIQACLNAICNAQRWIPVEEETPPSQKKVIITCETDKGRKYTAMAQFIPSMTVLVCDFLDDDYSNECAEYNEEKDEYFVVEGWWEYQAEADINWKISSKVISWRQIEIN